MLTCTLCLALTCRYTNGGWIGVIHTAIMTHLQPGKQYTYRVGDSAGGWSSLATFSTLPSDIGSKAHPLRMIQVGDMGFGDASNETIASITALVDKQDFDIMLHVGDVGACLVVQVAVAAAWWMRGGAASVGCAHTPACAMRLCPIQATLMAMRATGASTLPLPSRVHRCTRRHTAVSPATDAYA